jgi:hypothetical protein
MSVRRLHFADDPAQVVTLFRLAFDRNFVQRAAFMTHGDLAAR